MTSSIGVDHHPDTLSELASELNETEQAERQLKEANPTIFEGLAELRSRKKELKESIGDIMSENNMETYVSGDRVFARTVKPKVLVNKKRVEQHMGAAAFEEYAAANVEMDDTVRVTKRRKGKGVRGSA